MPELLEPQNETEIKEMIKRAAFHNLGLQITGGGSKETVGLQQQTSSLLTTGSYSGITRYEPSELFLTAKSGTAVAEIEAALEVNNQMLAFEPLDFNSTFWQGQRQGSIGGVFATNLCGSRRLSAGSARDHLLGIKFINGLGEGIKAGGTVLKNVTGYDVCKLVTGSWGTLGVLTEITMKVLPIPEALNTIVLYGLNHNDAIKLLCSAYGTPYEVSGGMHIEASLTKHFDTPGIKNAEASITLIRIENFSNSVAYRVDKLSTELSSHSNIDMTDVHILDHEPSLSLWREIRALKFLTSSAAPGKGTLSDPQAGPKTGPVWRLSTAPNKGGQLLDAIRQTHREAQAAFDWSGGLIWLIMPTNETLGDVAIRNAIKSLGGHATLIKGNQSEPRKVDVFNPLDKVTTRLSAKLKAAFDPVGILNPGRMYAWS